MKLNAITFNENLIVIFRADKIFNKHTRDIVERRRPARSEYRYEIEKEIFYLLNKKRIDDEIEFFGNAFFPLASSYEAHEKSRYDALVRAFDKCSNLQ
jgi:hypothetical protein